MSRPRASTPSGRGCGARRLLAALVGSAVLVGCGPGKAPAPPEPGAALYRDWDCGLCHGPAGEGSELGPPLRHLASEWDAEDLAAYLADPPASVASRPRLREIQAYYPEARMPAYGYPEPSRRTLARWLLEPADGGAR